METVYGSHEDTRPPSTGTDLSERVQNLASSVYREFEVMMNTYGDGVIKDLMPQVVAILENLNQAYRDKQDNEIELELLRVEHDNLKVQFEREKQLRKSSEQKYLEIEDVVDEERKTSSSKINQLESTVRALQIKLRNSQELLIRHEDSEKELKEDCRKLHNKYNELFKTHVEFVEKTKLQQSESPIRLKIVSSPATETETRHERVSSDIKDGLSSADSIETSALTRLPKLTTADSVEYTANVDDASKPHVDLVDNATAAVGIDAIKPYALDDESDNATLEETKSLSDVEPVVGNLMNLSLFDELSEHGHALLGEVDNGSDLTAGGVSAAVETLIIENNELLATKNALNIVKNDLITQVDELSGEIDLLKEENGKLQLVIAEREKHISELETELKTLKDSSNGQQSKGTGDAEPQSHFTRIDLMRVLVERNQYKERLMELQEAVRRADMARAAAKESQELMHQNQKAVKKKSSLWGFFSGLVSSEDDGE